MRMPEHADAENKIAENAPWQATTLLFVAANDGNQPHLRALCEQVSDVSASFIVAPPLAQADLIKTHPDMDAVVLELMSTTPDVIRRVGELAKQVAARGARLVAASYTLSQADMVNLLRVGVSDFLPLPCAKSDVQGLVEAIVSAKDRPTTTSNQAGRVITFAHSSGGAGASTLAVNSAAMLRRLNPSLRVCVLDLDLQYGSVASLLDVRSRSAILDIIETPDRLDAAMLSALMVDHPMGVRVLTAPERPLPLDALTPETVHTLIATAQSACDVVIVDLPCALTRWTATVLEASTDVFVVTQLDVPAVHRLLRMLEALESEGMADVALKLVANRVNRRHDTHEGPSVGQVEKAIGRPINFLIPNDFRAMTASANNGAPLCAKASGRYHDAVRTLLTSVVALDAAPSPRRGVARLLGGKR